jgi:hypothetical protein
MQQILEHLLGGLIVSAGGEVMGQALVGVELAGVITTLQFFGQFNALRE